MGEAKTETSSHHQDSPGDTIPQPKPKNTHESSDPIEESTQYSKGGGMRHLIKMKGVTKKFPQESEEL
jgi:hypothetical protein